MHFGMFNLGTLWRNQCMTFKLYAVLVVLLISACGKDIETESVDAPPPPPTVSYEPLLVSDSGVDNLFTKFYTEFGTALHYQSRAGVFDLMGSIVDNVDGTGYVVVKAAYKFGAKYVLIISTGEQGLSCPATTYAVTFDSESESVTGKVDIDGCSEIVQSLAEGNKLIVKKDGKASVFYNGEVK